MATAELSFEEFRAIQSRERNRQKSEKTLGKTKTSGSSTSQSSSSNNKPRNPDGKLGSESRTERKSGTSEGDGDEGIRNDKPGLFGSIGEFLELHQMQIFVIVILVLDSFASFAEMYLKLTELSNENGNVSGIAGGKKASGTLAAILDSWSSSESALISFFAMALKKYLVDYIEIQFILDCLRSFTSFTLFFFTLEVAALLIAFGVNVIGHYGYATDLFVVAIQLLLELRGNGKETRLLNIFRFWRVARLVNALVGVEKELHEETKELLQLKDVEMKKVESESRRIAGEFAKEKEARDAIEEMLQNYKNEVETLNEALKIAAMDIAEVAQADDDYFMSDDEEDVDDLGDAESLRTGSASATSTNRGGGNLYMDAAASEYDRVRNKEVLYREARAAAAESMEGSSNASNTGVTFLVHQDGTFEKK